MNKHVSVTSTTVSPSHNDDYTRHTLLVIGRDLLLSTAFRHVLKFLLQYNIFIFLWE